MLKTGSGKNIFFLNLNLKPKPTIKFLLLDIKIPTSRTLYENYKDKFDLQQQKNDLLKIENYIFQLIFH